MTGFDRQEIVDTINLYGVALDMQQWKIFDQIFTPNVFADFGETAQWSDLNSFKTDFAAFHAPFDATQHTMANHVVRFCGDRASAITYGNWRLVRRGVDGGELWEGTGWYDDTLIKTYDGWRISRRLSRVTWWEGNALVNQPTSGVDFAVKRVSLRDETAEGRVSVFPALLSV